MSNFSLWKYEKKIVVLHQIHHHSKHIIKTSTNSLQMKKPPSVMNEYLFDNTDFMGTESKGKKYIILSLYNSLIVVTYEKEEEEKKYS